MASPSVLSVSLEAAVPAWIALLRDLSFSERQRIAAEAAAVVSSQGDTLQYGGRHKFGHGEKEKLRHQQAGRCPGKDCPCANEAVAGHEERVRDCTRCADRKCYCHIRGEPSYSAGEVFNHLARGLACLALQRGGVRFAGLSWCGAHPREPWGDGDTCCPACLREETAARGAA